MNILIIGAGGQIPEYLIPMLQKKVDMNLTLLSRNADLLPYEGVTKVTDQASKLKDLLDVMAGQDVVYMNFDDKSITEVVIEAMKATGVKWIIQAGVLGVYGEVVPPFEAWNSRMLGGSIAYGRGNEALEASDLNYLYMRMTWLYNGDRDDYVASPKGEPFKGAQITRKAIAQFVIDALVHPDKYHRASIGLWEPGSENKAKPDFY